MADTRGIVLEVLLEYESGQAFLSELIRQVLTKYAYLEERDRAFIKTLAEGSVEKQIALDHCIDSVSKTPVRKMKKVIRAILRMTAYQLLFMDHVPRSAACNEAVKLAKKKHIQGLSGFVNGVARALAEKSREGGPVFPDEATEYSCPAWIASKLEEDHGTEKASAMIRSMGGRPPLFLRVNLTKGGIEEVSELLRKEGISAEPAPFPGEALRAPEGLSPVHSEAFLKGFYSVQDISSMAAVKAALETLMQSAGEERKALSVLDVCAAPGGKACYAAELLSPEGDSRGPEGFVRAFDVSEGKLARIRENLERLGLRNCRAEVRDARSFDPALEASADLLIADLPCSGLGVMNRKVDIKYRVQPGDILELCKLQREILENVRRYLKPGGVLLFSTCTVTREETVQQAEWIEDRIGLHKVTEKQFLQGIDPCDGFYYAVFIMP